MADAPAGQPCNSVPTAVNWYRDPAPPTALPAAAAGVLPYKWSRVTWKANQSVEGYAVDGDKNPVSLTANKGVCWDGGRERVMPPAVLTCQAMAPSMTPVYLITSLAVTQTGARRITQMEVAKNIVRIPSALTLDGDQARTTFGTPTSAKFGISGVDACTGAVLPGIGVVSPADDTGVTAELFRPSNYDGEGGAPSVIDLTTPSNPPRLEGLETVGDLKKLVGEIIAQADPAHIIDMASPPPTIPSFGTPGVPSTSTITVIKGDYPGPCDGQGVLVVTGNLTCGGNTKFEGLILVVGKGHFQADGGGNGYINGALLVANLFDETGKELPDSSKPGIPTFDWNGGGTNFIQYDSCKILDALNKAPYRLLAMREVNY
jgi:hypothetical protein